MKLEYRPIAVIALTLLSASVALAQTASHSGAGASRGSSLGSGTTPPVTVHRVAPQVPPMPSAPPPRYPPQIDTPTASPFAATPFTYAPSPSGTSRPHRGRPYGGLPYVGAGLPYIVGGYATTSAEPAVPVAPPIATGTLRLDVEPYDAQVFVDGDFVGTVDEFNRAGGVLSEGRHRMTVRASGYFPLRFSVTITPRGVATYADALHPDPLSAPAPSLAAPPPASNAPAGGDTFYVIPRCYIGNRPPTAADLPAGCDLQDVRKYSPR